jgi:hypothetical protein
MPARTAIVADSKSPADPFRRVGLFDLGENPWHETAFRTVAAALAKLTEQPAG